MEGAPRPVETARAAGPALEERKIARKNTYDGPDTLTVEAAEVPDAPTRVLDNPAAERLFGNTGMTLQWIGWDQRGQAFIAIDEGGVWWLAGEQRGPGGASVSLEGHITEIGPDYFLFSGDITILGAPDADRLCKGNKQWRFAVTQDRKYWRLREFEWCDGLTDYIDIYF